MNFQIPDLDTLGQFSVSGLKEMKNQAKTEYDEIKADVAPDTVTEEQLQDLKDLRHFWFSAVPEELEGRTRRAGEFNSLEDEEDGDEEDDSDDDADDKAKKPVPVTAGATVNTATEVIITPTIADIVKASDGNATKVPQYERPRYSALVAAAGVPNKEAGAEFDNLLDVAKAFEARSAGHSRITGNVNGPVHYPVAVLQRNYPAEFSVQGDETDYAKLLEAGNESRLPGGSLIRSVQLRQEQIRAEHPERDALVAAAGWCAPSETDYDICLQITTDGLADFPEVQARRGGIRHNTGIEFDSIFGAGTGYFDLTEAQVAAGTTKTCLEIPCPAFVDTRLGVTGLCLTGNILSIRGYPEFTATFTRGALAASAHQINREQIADVVAASTSVNLTGVQPWTSDGTVVSQVMSAVEMAAVDIKYRLRMQRSATLEVIMPFWVLAQMRADWIRRNATGSGPEAVTLADGAINAAFTARGARVQFVYDWQDAFSNGAASGAGADTPITSLPLSMQFLMYPAGTWVRAVSDVITLNSVYDSTKLATNQVTHLFTETGWAMVQMCPVSRVYTVPICPSGRTGAQAAVVCA